MSGGERGKGLTLFATGLSACSGSACGGKGAKQKAGEINGRRGGMVFKTGDGRAGKFRCAFGGLGSSGALASAFKDGEQRGLIKFNCPTMLNLRGNW